MDILDRARRMKDVVHLEIGEPDLEPPPGVIEAFTRAVKDGKYKYTSALGLMELRETIAEYYQKRYKIHISPERIAITPGTSGAFLVVYAMLLDKGQKIILSDPSYPCYKNFSYFLDADPEFVPVNADDGYCINTNELKRYFGVKALQISSPSNPLGTLYKKDRLIELIDYAKRNHIDLISDEIYHGLVYDEKEHSALEFDDDVVVINGFSKYYCMPGFRVGWMILPEKLVRKAEMAIQNVFIAANTPAQHAALAAFDEDYLGTVRDTFRERRDYLYSALADIFSIPLKPEGAFYLWANIERYGMNSSVFVERLLNDAHVAITPGIDFGKHETDRFVRFAFTRPLEELEEGVERIKEFLSGLQN
jgi:aspartate/methionine/tyrosine aminotransferase